MGLLGPSSLERELNDNILGLRTDIARLEIERKATTEERDLSKKIVDLQAEIARLTVQESQITEEYERQEREVRHEVGLLRRQVETERELATQEAVLKVREENLDADRKRFEEQMKFTAERFETEVGYLREIMAQIMKRLPTIEVDLSRRISDGPVNGHAEAD